VNTLESNISRYLKVAILAGTTKEMYRHYLELLAAWIQERHIIPESMNDELFYDFLAEHPDWSDSTRHSAACAFKSFYRYQHGAFHPSQQVHIRRKEPGPQRSLTAEQAGQLLTSLDTTSATGIRNLAIVTLMLDTGLRAAEVCRLEIDRVNLVTCHLDVVIKGGEWGEGIFSEYTASCLAGWLSARTIFAKPGVNTVFVGIKGTKPGYPLCGGGLRTVFRKMGARAGLGLISPHDLRRSMATLAIENGAPSRTVQKAGRWSNIEMVEHYTRTLDAKTFKKFFPVARILDTGSALTEATRP
jgi:integrase/recombinase XerD